MKNSTLVCLAVFNLVLNAVLVGQTLQIQPPTGPLPVRFCDYSPNDPAAWEFDNPDTWDALHMTHDLSEIAVSNLNLNARAIAKDCPGPISWKFRMRLDVDSDSLPDLEWSSFPGISPSVQVTAAGDTSFVEIIFPADQTLPHGHHKMEWMAAAGCGLTDTLRFEFDILDCKNPEVVCVNGLEFSITVGPPTGLYLLASQFLQYAEDNCTPTSQLEIAIRDADINPGSGFPLDAAGLPQTKLRWDCSQLGTNTVELWARDRSGNADFCLTYLILKDNTGVCSHPSVYFLGGCVACPDGSPVSNLKGTLVSAFGTPLFSFDVPGSGCFDAGWSDGNPFFKEIRLEKNTNFLEGISTFDAVQLNLHLLGVKPFSNPYQYIAADINRDGQVDSTDLLELTKAITGVYTKWPANDFYRFLPADFQFTTTNPASELFPESPFPVGLFQDTLGLHFIAVQIGNLNGCVTGTSPAAEPLQSVDNQCLVSPNPFSNQLEIRFFMPENGPARCSFFDPTGKKMAVETGSFSMGEQVWQPDLSRLPSIGLFTMTLETGRGIWSKQVVRN